MTKRQATAAGNRLLRRLKGTGWKVDVWENLGWQYAVRLDADPGNLSVYEDTDGRYSCLLGSDGCGGQGCWTTLGGRHKDPNAAVKKELASARAVVAKCQKAVESVAQHVEKGARP